MTRIQTLRALLLFEAATFVVASTIHFGGLVDGYAHRKAAIAETVIAVALLVGLAISLRSGWALEAALGAQAFALFGVLVGLFTIAVGVGPRTAPDVAYHVGIAAVLATGIALAARAGPGRAAPAGS
jgi:hypothetical protein